MFLKHLIAIGRLKQIVPPQMHAMAILNLQRNVNKRHTVYCVDFRWKVNTLLIFNDFTLLIKLG